MDKHVSNVCSVGLYRLRQLRRVRRLLDTESAATIVHAFVTSCIDYCNVLFARAPKDWIGLCSVLRPRQHSTGYMGQVFTGHRRLQLASYSVF